MTEYIEDDTASSSNVDQNHRKESSSNATQQDNKASSSDGVQQDVNRKNIF